jgi:hypothetical protein
MPDAVGKVPRSDWREPAARLRARLAVATGAQHELAGHLRIALPADAPALLAAAILCDALGAIIDAPPKPNQTRIDRAGGVRGRPVGVVGTGRSAAGYPRGRQCAADDAGDATRAGMLEAIQLRAGDVVVEWRRSDLRNDDELDPKRLRLVASIADAGTVYFQGGGGHRARVDRLESIAEAD